MATTLHPQQYAAAIVLGGCFRSEFPPTTTPSTPAAPRAPLRPHRAGRPPSAPRRLMDRDVALTL